MTTPKSNFPTFITGLLIGAAAGAIAGILLAPDKGSETRKQISNKIKVLKDNLPEHIDALKAAIEQKIEEIKSSAKDL